MDFVRRRLEEAQKRAVDAVAHARELAKNLRDSSRVVARQATVKAREVASQVKTKSKELAAQASSDARSAGEEIRQRLEELSTRRRRDPTPVDRAVAGRAAGVRDHGRVC